MNPTWEDDKKHLAKELPNDLPKSLNDRIDTTGIGTETEIYDAWQEQSQYISPTPLPTNFKNFDLSLDDNHNTKNQPQFDNQFNDFIDDNNIRLNKMLESQSKLRSRALQDGEETILNNTEISVDEKKRILQDIFIMKCSNGEVKTVKKFFESNLKDYININGKDTDGNYPIIYASCFGHIEIVQLLIDHNCTIDITDNSSWTSLMWAITNRQRDIVKILLDNGASLESKTLTGRRAFDFLVPNSDLYDYLQRNNYIDKKFLSNDDFYKSGISSYNFEEEMIENEMKQRMLMESSINLGIDIGNLTLDDYNNNDNVDDNINNGDDQEFIWDKCLYDQMFVFQESDLDNILTVIINKMTPSRSPTQKPIPANIIFLASRYAHYHANKELLQILLSKAFSRINDVVEIHQWDMTMLAFWLSNSTLLLHYLKKDAGLVDSTTKYQLALEDVIEEIFILIIRDAERRLDKNLDKALLEYESIPGFENVTFQNQWKIFRSRPKQKQEDDSTENLKRFKPPSPKRLAQISPRNITSLLSSTLFVLELYDIHSVIIVQVINQLLYWLGTEIFNRIMDNRKYLARTKAMQIRMNVLTIEDWARLNNRQPDHYENGSITKSGETIVEAAKKHLEPILQLLQWLQAMSTIEDDFEALITTLKQLPRLNPTQLLHSIKYYRSEVGEKSLSKDALKYITSLQAELADRKAQGKIRPFSPNNNNDNNNNTNHKNAISDINHAHEANQINQINQTPTTPIKDSTSSSSSVSISFSDPNTPIASVLEEDYPDNLFMDPALVLPFTLPTVTDMLVSYGAGFGGSNKERERRYIPTVPPEFLNKLDFGNGIQKSSIYNDTTTWD